MQLYVIRHAKAKAAGDEQADIERELTGKGKNSARQLAAKLRELQAVPAMILCSPAVRARQTCGILTMASDYLGHLTYCPELFDADAEEYFSILAQYGGSADPLAVVAHNPAIEDFLRTLTGNEHRMKTANAAILDCECTRWDQLKESSVLLREIVVP